MIYDKFVGASKLTPRSRELCEGGVHSLRLGRLQWATTTR